MYLGLHNKTAIVTAGSKGLGGAVVSSLIGEGAKVAFCSSNPENVRLKVESLGEKYKGIIFGFVCDLNDKESISEFYSKAVDVLGHPDILVNNCGGPAPGFFEDLDEEKWSEGFNQALMSAVRLTELVLPAMKEKKWGRVINITSLSVKQPVDNLLLSNTFRSGLTAFAKSISNAYGKYGITVNNVAPGHILTDRLVNLLEIKAKNAGKTYEEIFEILSKEMPVQRFGKPEEFASAVTFLASEQASYITGVTLQVDGGIIKSTY